MVLKAKAGPGEWPLSGTARADGIATFNLRDFMGPAKQFGIEVMRPGEAMKRLE